MTYIIKKINKDMYLKQIINKDLIHCVFLKEESKKYYTKKLAQKDLEKLNNNYEIVKEKI